MAAVSRAHFRMNLTGTGGRPPASTAKLHRSRVPEAESEAAVKTAKDFISLFAMLLFLATAAAGCSGETDDRAGEIVAGGEGRSVLGDMTGAGSLGALLADARVIDLSHAYDENTIYWPTSEGFALETVFKGKTEDGYWYEANNFGSAEHGGTHIDAPVHFAAGHQTVDQIPLEKLIGPGIVIDISDRAMAGDEGRDYQISIADFQRWETENDRRIAPGTIVLLQTGYGQWWRDRAKYLGTAERGEAAVARLRFPGLHPDAARWLVTERYISAVGLDTPSIDFGRSELFDAHRILFAADVPAFENLAGLEQLPPADFLVAALPMKIRGGSGGPLRAVAIVPVR